MAFGQISQILLNSDNFSQIFRVWVKWTSPVHIDILVNYLHMI